MLRVNERKYALSDEVAALWARLKAQHNEKKLERELWLTRQGQAIARTLQKANRVATKVTIEKRPEDKEENLYLKVMPCKR